MSDNPRILLALFWMTLAFRCFADALGAHTLPVAIGNAIGAVVAPIWAYLELRRGLAERKARLGVPSDRRG